MFSFFSNNKIKSIDINEVDSKIPNIKLIDIRETYETNAGTIKSAKKVPMGNLLENPGKFLKMDEEYYLMCQSGMRSSRTAKKLGEIGYNVVNVKGGFGSYRGKNIKR